MSNTVLLALKVTAVMTRHSASMRLRLRYRKKCSDTLYVSRKSVASAMSAAVRFTSGLWNTRTTFNSCFRFNIVCMTLALGGHSKPPV